MELKEFVETTLTEIVQAVEGANTNLSKEGRESAFRLMKGYEGYLEKLQTKNPGFIDFDVAVSVRDDKTTGGKAGIKVAVVELGGSLDKSSSAEQVSRIRFSVGINREIS